MSIRKIPKETSTFHFHNQNPKNLRTTDCVIRAISFGLNKSWETVVREISETSISMSRFVDEKVIDRYLSDNGFVKFKQPRKYDNTKFTGKDFCKELYQQGKFLGDIVCNIGGHHMVVLHPEDNCRYKVYDIWDSSDGCIGNYWIHDSFIEMV